MQTICLKFCRNKKKEGLGSERNAPKDVSLEPLPGLEHCTQCNNRALTGLRTPGIEALEVKETPRRTFL